MNGFVVFSHRIKRLFILLLLSCISLGCLAVPYSVELLDESDGFSSSIIFSIAQDQRGFLWFGTAYDGVLRYDGKNVVSYSIDSPIGYQLPDNNSGNLNFDTDNNLWIGGWGSGAVKLDPLTGEFKQFKHQEGVIDTIGSPYIQNIFVDTKDRVWLGSNGGGLNLYNPSQDNFKRFDDNGFVLGNPLATSFPRIWDIEQSASDVLWLATGHGLNRLNTNDFRFSHYVADDSIGANGVNKVRKVVVSKNNQLVLGTHDGVMIFNPKNETFTPVLTAQKKTLGPIFSLLKTSFGEYWVSTNKGVYFFTDQTLQLEKVPLGIDDSCSQTLFEDRQNIIWMSCEGSGVYKIQRNTIFQSLNTPVTRSTYSLALGKNGRILLGTESNGIHAWDRKTGKLIPLSNSLHSGTFPSVNRIAQLKSGNILYSNFDSLYILDKQGESRRIMPPAGTPRGANFGGIVHLQEMSNGEIWIGTQQGVYIVDDLSRPFRYLAPIKGQNNSLASASITEIYEDKQNRIWIGTTMGLHLWRPETGDIQRFFVNDLQEVTFSNFINAIFQDDLNRLWVTTRLGLYKADFSTNTLMSENVDAFSKNFGVHFIFNDNEDNLWLFNHTGIVKYNPSNGRLLNYDRSDGLSGSRFFVNLVTQDEEGTIYYSSRDGIHFFNPNEVKDRQTNVPTYLTHFEVLGSSRQPVKILHPEHRIELDPSENYIKLEFSTLDLINAAQLKYEYKLDGLDDNWIDNGSNNAVVYTNLDGGDYTFRVRPYIKNDLYYTPELVVPISIGTPIWQQWWMLVIYSALLLLCINIYIRYRQHQSELEIEQQKQFVTELERQVNEKTETIVQESQKLATANQVKSEFLANMSHEIRTPLTSVIGHSESIIHGDVEAGEVLDEVSKIHSHGRYLMALLNDILDVTKIEQNKIDLEPSNTDIHELLDDIQDMFTFQADKKGLAFSILRQLPPELHVLIDGLRLKQVLLNLCSNAIKFTPKGKVTLIVSYSEHRITFNVVDTGIGMTSEQMDKIFDVFTQGDSSINRRFGGSGLGLSLSSKLVELMGGQLSVSSDLNKGSMFTFSLDLIECNQETHNDTQEPGEGLPTFQGCVLLADDHKDNRNLISRLLTRLGLKVATAEDGFEAISMCKDVVPDLIMLDIQMPEKDGIQTYKELRVLGYKQPIIALTANVMEHDVDRYQQVGFDGYLSKPLNREKLLNILNQYFTSHTNTEDALACLESTKSDDLKQQFISSLESEQTQFRQALAAKDYEALEQLAHRLAGAAQLFDCKPLAEAASALERSLAQSDNKDIEALIQGVMIHINALID